MSTVTTVALEPRRRLRSGPALHGFSLPLGPLALSAGAHALLVIALILAATVWRAKQPRTYVVNLVPAIPALGVPNAPPAPPVPRVAPTPPALPAPPAPPAPRATPAPPVVLPPRPTVEDPPPRISSVPAPKPPAESHDLPPSQMPSREPPPRDPPRIVARDMPSRELAPRELAPLDRPLPPRPPAVTRPGEKEAPTVRRTEFPRSLPPLSAARPAAPPAVARVQPPSPPAPLGRPSGSAQGSGALTISSSGDFPFTWYLQRVTAKVQSRWAAPRESQEGQVAVIVFEITRDGKIARAVVEKTSGNAAYDLAALRAVSEASPFPPLPDEFTEPPLRVHLGIHYSKRG